jgi:hypothetical protein
MPTWTPERSTVNQRVQVGVEASGAHGVAVAANKVLQCFSFVFGPNANTQTYRATGRKYSSSQVENTEWVDGTCDGPIDYNGIIYVLAGIMGAVTPTAHGASTVAKDWTFIPPVTGSLEPSTYTFQQGETVTRAHQLAYGLFTDWGYKGDRETGLTLSSTKLLAQPLSDGITMTSSPTLIALAPLAGKHLNLYLDTTSANLGTTQLLKVLNIDTAGAGFYGPFYPFNRANLGWTSHVDMAPKATIKLLMEADAVGMTELSYLQSGSTQFLRIQGQGSIIDNLQTVTIGGGATGGTFTLGYKGVTTANITYSATLAASVVNTAFQGLSTVLTNCTVTGSAGGPYTFTFSGTLANDMSPVIATNTGLSGGTPTITSVAQAYNVFQHDMALKVVKPNPFSDSKGVFAEEWDFEIVEDATWGNAQKVLVTNLLTGL